MPETQQNKNARRKARRAYGLCDCGRQRTGHHWCERCRPGENAKQVRYRAKVKAEVFAHYSGGDPCCVRCSNKDLRVLVLDHINGGGCRDKMTRLGRVAGGGFYSALRKAGYPTGLQVLCHNCHAIIHYERVIARRSPATEGQNA